MENSILRHTIEKTPISFSYYHNKRAKRLILRFDAVNNMFRITAPKKASFSEIISFLNSSQTWVLKQIDKKKPRILFKHNTILPILGKNFTIVHNNMAHPFSVLFKEHSILVNVPQKDLDLFIARFLKDYAKKEFENFCSTYAAIIGKQFNKITIRDTKSRWGSCSAKGNISLSWRLLFAPKHVAEYVCAHEVAHLKEMNHKPAFWKIVYHLHPNYNKSELWLKENGKDLLLYGTLW